MIVVEHMKFVDCIMVLDRCKELMHCCTGSLSNRTLFVGPTVAAVCHLAGRDLRVAVYKSLKTLAIAVCGIAVYRFIEDTLLANGVNILKSIDEGPFQMGTFRETLAEGNEGALHLGPKRARVYSDLLPDNVKMLLEGYELTKEDRESQLYDDFEHFRQNKGETIHDYYVWFAKLINDMLNIKMTMSKMQLNSKFVNNTLPEWGRFVTAVKLNRGELRTELEMQIQVKQGRLSVTTATNGVALDEEQLLFIVADDCDAFDSDVDEAPVAQMMFMANLSSADPVYDEASLSYDSDILSEVPDHDNYQDAICEHHEVHEMHDDVQPNYVVDSHADYTSDSNMIPYDQYVKDNAVPIVESNVSSNNVVDKSLTTELVTYKEQVELYERQAKFELTEREQKIEEQLRIVITDRNIKEEKLKKERHSVKMQLSSSINHNKSMVEEVSSLKKDLKQKENKYLEEFLDMKALKE
ncbi:hypothetical protein Tco_0089905 [Tanacetum coccineum]